MFFSGYGRRYVRSSTTSSAVDRLHYCRSRSLSFLLISAGFWAPRSVRHDSILSGIEPATFPVRLIDSAGESDYVRYVAIWWDCWGTSAGACGRQVAWLSTRREVSNGTYH